MAAIIAFVGEHWLQWVFAAATAFLGYLYRRISVALHDEQKKNAAIAEGVQALLRDCIVTGYNKWQDRGYCPIYAKQSLSRVYMAYHNLNGNDVATELYKKLLAMPEEKKEENV